MTVFKYGVYIHVCQVSLHTEFELQVTKSFKHHSFCYLVLAPHNLYLCARKVHQKLVWSVKVPVAYFGWAYHLIGKCGTLCTTLPRLLRDQASKHAVIP